MQIGSRLKYEPGEVLARLRVPATELKDSLQELGTEILERFDFGHQLHGDGELVRLKLPPKLNVQEGIEKLVQRSDVVYAEPNYRYYLEDPRRGSSPSIEMPESDEAPDDLHYRLWGLHNSGQTRGKPGADISIKEAWTQTVGDRVNGPIVAIIDSGVDISHPDLIDNLWVNTDEVPGDGIDNDGNGVVDDIHGYNAYHDNNDLSDGKVHGTHVAGTVGATGNNGQGITGVAQQASIMTIKIFGDVGHTNGATVLRGLAYADRMGARITANSWGGIYSKAMEEAYAASPALHIASAGNSGRDNDVKPHYPGSYRIDNMIAVAATDHKDRRGSFSSYGAQTVHIAAPGEKIYSTLPGGRYKEFSGTSMACPHVAGAASLVLTKYPGSTNKQVRDRLLYSSDPLPELEPVTVSGGRMNAGRALQADEQPPGKPRNFEATRHKSGAFLKWEPLGDDGQKGSARRTVLTRTQANAEPIELHLGYGESAFQDKLPLSKSAREITYSLLAIDDVGNVSPTSEVSIKLPSAKVHFEDTPATEWGVEGSWAVSCDEAGQRVWTESPNGDYDNRTKAVLTSPGFDLSGAQGQTLCLRGGWQLERGDFLKIQARTDKGGWRTIGKLEGSQEESRMEYGLDQFASKNTQVRFVFQSDYSRVSDGVSLSAIEVLSEN